MGYGDDLLITKFASKIKKQFPDRQIVIGEAKNQSAYHSIVYENNPNISDCRNLEKSKPTHIIDYHPYNRPYIDYEKSTNTNYVWKKFKPNPGEIYFTKEEKVDAKKIISEAIKFWRRSNKKNYKKIIFLETSSTKVHDRQFSIKHQNKDWGAKNWQKLIDVLIKDFLVIISDGRMSSVNRYLIVSPDLEHSLNFSLLKLIEEELLGKVNPITSKIVAIVFAV